MSLTLTRSLQGAGKVLAQQAKITTGQDMLREASVPKAWAGSLTQKTDSDTGQVTVTDPNYTTVITNGARVDLYWSGGARRGMTVGTVAAFVPIDLGTGDALPNVGTAVTIAVSQQFDFLFDGSDLKALAFGFKATPGLRGTFVLTIASSAEQYSAVIPSDSMAIWTSEDGTANPVLGDAIAKLFMSHEDVTASRTMSALVGVL